MIMEASNGEEALAGMESFLPDLLLTDLNMPVMDAFELIERVHSDIRQEDIPIIVLTSSIVVEVNEKVAMLGANDFTIKTTDMRDDLIPRIRRYIT